MDGRQMRKLQEALLVAFPTESHLRQMVRFGLEENLSFIAGDDNLRYMVFKLIQWADAHGRLPDLIAAAVQDNPGNPQLRAFAASTGIGSTGNNNTTDSPQMPADPPERPSQTEISNIQSSGGGVAVGGNVYDHRTYILPSPPSAPQFPANAPQEANDRTQVFISYSHQDRRWLGRLQTHLRPLVRQGVIDLWDDTQIAKGADWQATIQAALARARVAVLLVTPDFLASEFVATQELPRLLEGAAQGGMTILWIAVRPSSYQRTPIARYQAANDPARPLSGLNPTQRDQVLVQICEVIARAAGAERQGES